MANPFARRYPGSHALLAQIEETQFDGNNTDAMSNWLFPLPDTRRLDDIAFEQLMAMTVEDHNLSWVLFPPGPFRM